MRIASKETLASLLASSVLLAGSVALASGPVVWTQAGVELAAGERRGVTLDGEGRVLLAPQAELLLDTLSPRIWSMEVAPDGTVYLAVGEEGQVFRVRPGDDPEVFFVAPQLGAQAMVLGADGFLYVAAGPRGSIYRVPPEHDGGTLEAWFTPGDTYVWALAFGPEGRLYVATGAPGRIWRVDSDGSGTVFCETSEEHVRALAIDEHGTVYAGTADGGHVYRIGPDGDLFVLYDADEPEITSLVIAEGQLWAGAFGGPGATKPAPEGSSVVVATNEGTPTPATSATGSVYRIHADGYVEKMWTSTEAAVHSMERSDSGVIIGTGPGGELVRIDAEGGSSRLARLGGEQVVALRRAASGEVLAATSNLGRVYRLSTGFRDSGEYLSAVKDTATNSSWGAIRWRADVPARTTVEFATRSGNTADPDMTWSAWSAPESGPGGSQRISSPSARFIQWRALLSTSDSSRSPTLYRVEITYVPRNLAPEIDRFRVHPAGVVYRQTNSFEDGLPFAQLPQAIALALRESEGAGAGDGVGAGRVFLGRPFFIAGLQTLTWQGSDPNGDQLMYRLQFRAEDETSWKPMTEGLSETMYSFDTRRVPDGTYVARLTATDVSDNPESQARSDTEVSRAFTVDNTPPVISSLEGTVEAGAVRVTGRIIDATSLIRRIQYSVDGAEWRTVVSADGVTDSSLEALDTLIDGLEPGEHTLVVRASDTALNATAGRLVLVIER